jgi:hypothetical protein
MLDALFQTGTSHADQVLLAAEAARVSAALSLVHL